MGTFFPNLGRWIFLVVSPLLHFDRVHHGGADFAYEGRERSVEMALVANQTITNREIKCRVTR